MFVTRQIIIIILFIFSIWSSFCGCDQDLETRARYIQLMGILKPLNTRDRLTTRLNYIGANLKSTKNLILYSSITSNEECVLKRFDQVEERCEELDRQVCKQGCTTILIFTRIARHHRQNSQFERQKNCTTFLTMSYVYFRA